MKKLNLNLLKTLVETDFTVVSLSKKLKTSKLSCFDSTISFSNSNDKIASLDLHELVKTLKQTLRLIQFINNKDKNQLLIHGSNKQYLNLLSLELSSFQKKVTINERFTKTSNVDNISQLLLLLEDSLGNKKRILKKLFEDQIFLINKINSKVEINNWGTYKVNNELDDFKKLIFIIVLLKHVLK